VFGARLVGGRVDGDGAEAVVTGAQFARKQAAAEPEAVLAARPRWVNPPRRVGSGCSASRGGWSAWAWHSARQRVGPGTARSTPKRTAAGSESVYDTLAPTRTAMLAPRPAARKRIGESDSERSSGLVVSDGAGSVGRGGVAVDGAGCVGSRSNTATAPTADAT
jgi:hypothetical protein